MPAALPILLLIAWSLFFGFLNTHQRHSTSFKGASESYLALLNLSVILGSVAGLAVLGFYFYHVSWYWPIVLFVAGSLIGGILFAFLDRIVGQMALSLVAFIGWPAAAIWAFFIIRGIMP